MEAGQLLFENNPLSAICATVCDHMAQYAEYCVRRRKGEPVHFYEIEQFVSDTYLDRMSIEKVSFNDKNAAVIGSEPAGLTVAIQLARRDMVSPSSRKRIKLAVCCNMASRISVCPKPFWTDTRPD